MLNVSVQVLPVDSEGRFSGVLNGRISHADRFCRFLPHSPTLSFGVSSFYHGTRAGPSSKFFWGRGEGIEPPSTLVPSPS